MFGFILRNFFFGDKNGTVTKQQHNKLETNTENIHSKQKKKNFIQYIVIVVQVPHLRWKQSRNGR